MDEYALLLEGHRDGTLDGAARTRLAQAIREDPTLADQLLLGDLLCAAHRDATAAGHCTWHAVSVALETGTPGHQRATADAVAAHVARRRFNCRRRPRCAWWLLAAAATLCLGLGLWWLDTTVDGIPADTSPRLAHSLGDLTIDGRPATTASRLAPGATMRIPAGGSATLVYDDGSRIVLDGASTCTLGSAPGIDLRLVTGSLHAGIANGERPVRITTPYGDARVQGTVFGLHLADQRTRLAVREGIVAFTPRHASTASAVHGGQFLTSDHTRPQPLYTYAEAWGGVFTRSAGQRYRRESWLSVDAVLGATFYHRDAGDLYREYRDLGSGDAPSIGLRLTMERAHDGAFVRLDSRSERPTGWTIVFGRAPLDAFACTWRMRFARLAEDTSAYSLGVDDRYEPETSAGLPPRTFPPTPVAPGRWYDCQWRFIRAGTVPGTDTPVFEVRCLIDGQVQIASWTRGRPSSFTLTVRDLAVDLRDLRLQRMHVAE